MKTWYFTFCGNHELGGYCQPIKAQSWGVARAKMFELYGEKWCFQYDEEQWGSMKNTSTKLFPLEKELEVVIAE